MRHSSLLRSLLASVVSLTLSHAAVIEERTCVSTDHYGTLAIFETYFSTTTGILYFQIGSVNTVPRWSDFGEATPDFSDVGQFHFNGCSDGETNFYLYCTNCDNGSGNYGVVGIRSDTYDSNGDPVDWHLYNSATESASHVTRRQDYTDSQFFTYDGTNIRPETYNKNSSIQGQRNVTVSQNGSISFIDGTVKAPSYYSLVWVENSGEH